MIQAVIHGIILSFGLILPLGVQNVFVFNQGATQPKFLRALPVVLTASVCDTLLISLAVLGVSVVVFGVYWVKVMLILAGALFLIYMGWVTFKSQPDPDQPQKSSLSPKKANRFCCFRFIAQSACHHGYDRGDRHQFPFLYRCRKACFYACLCRRILDLVLFPGMDGKASGKAPSIRRRDQHVEQGVGFHYVGHGFVPAVYHLKPGAFSSTWWRTNRHRVDFCCFNLADILSV